MNGFVYRIEDTLALDIHYIGSTQTSLEERFITHKCNYFKWLKGQKNNKIAIYPHFLKYGLDKFKIELLGEYEIKNKQDLLIWEQYHMDNNKDCINLKKAYQTKEQRKEYEKEYELINKEKLIKKKKEYYQKNKENKQEYYQKNKEKINKKKNCLVCNKQIIKIKDHNQSQKHNRNEMGLEDFDIK